MQKWFKEAHPEGEPGHRVLKDGLLYDTEGGKELLVVPGKLKPTVLRLAHDIPCSGHLVVEKTLR